MNHETISTVKTIRATRHNGNEERSTSPDRDALVEQWRKASRGILRYPEGTAFDDQGNILYTYEGGVRLRIGNEREVMDSCQKPWAIETVKQAFYWLDQNQTEKGPKQNVRVLERGFGLGLIATELMEELRKRGGTYTVIELNRRVAKYAKTVWAGKQNTISRAKATSEIGGRYTASNVGIEVREGDAFAETKKLAEEGRKVDVIISDTFPIIPEERSVNDLLDLETLVQCLDPKGVFAFFGYHSGSEGGMNERQRNLIERYFGEVHRTHVTVNPPPRYNYFKTPTGMLRRLPVLICTDPIINPRF